MAELSGDAYLGSAGGAPCGDLLSIELKITDTTVSRVRWQAEGCATARAAIACAAELIEGGSVLAAARVGPDQIAEELGGLDGQARHGADLASDALHRALSEASRSDEVLARPGEVETLVAISGGVDSAVAAELCRREGPVCTVTLKLWQDQRNDGDRSCCSPEAVLSARRLAHSMGLPHLTLDLRPEFRRGVVERFVEGYRNGTTPNPCVLCNGEVRIEPMVELGRRLGDAPLATGHYAQITDDGDGPLLAAAADSAKDQSYMLSGLEPRLLERLRFPLAVLTKPEVREIAREAEISVAGKAESQDLCFLAGEGKSGFLRRHGAIADRPGPIVDRCGTEVGRHHGAHHFTVGQRRGLGVSSPAPLYVTGLDAGSNRVSVGPREEAMRSTVQVRDVRLLRPAAQVDSVRLRYRSKALPATIHDANGAAPVAGRHPALTVELGESAFAPAPGQVAVMLSGDRVIGHATIDG